MRQYLNSNHSLIVIDSILLLTLLILYLTDSTKRLRYARQKANITL
jgi:hypothetical protein